MTKNNLDVVFDNGGGITIQWNGTDYIHYYDNPAHAAEDYKLLVNGANPIADGWDNNNPGEALEYDADQVRNGGYLWLDVAGIAAADERSINWGANTQEFFAAL